MRSAATALIVEDNVLVAQFLQKQLENMQFTPNHVTNATEAERFLQTLPCAVVFLDLNLPDAHGADLLTTWRARFPSTPVIIITADPLSEAYKSCEKTATAGVLEKPFNLEELNAVLSQALPEENSHYAGEYEHICTGRGG